MFNFYLIIFIYLFIFFILLLLLERGDVLVWGWNESGQLGLGHFESKFEPTLLPFSNGKVVRVFAGQDHSFLLTDDGSLWGFGK